MFLKQFLYLGKVKVKSNFHAIVSNYTGIKVNPKPELG